MSAPTRIPRNQLPDWAREALADTTAPVPERDVITDELRSESAWPLLVDAAVVSAFLPRDLAPGEASGSGRAAAERFVLKFAQTTATKSGAAWQLTREARTAVLGAALRAGDLHTAIRRTAGHFGDALSTALRECLSDTPPSTTEAPLERLEARRAALSLISSIPGRTPPPLGEIDRVIRRRRLIEQFERMCGKDYRTRIVGRDDELEELREYVGSIGAGTVSQHLNRAIVRVGRAISGRGTFVIWGSGGVGKTTLISCFMLEHIEAANKNFPFAYLDFDRSSVSPRDPYGLLSEICLQVSAQFPKLDQPLRELRDRIIAAQPREVNPDMDPLRSVGQHAREFRELIDGFLASEESLLEWARPFLLVFDTFEVVQYDQRQVEMLERFVRTLSGPNPQWTRLRLIVSGRRNQTEFMGETENHELEGVDLGGAATLLSRWAAAAQTPLSEQNAAALARSLGIRRRRFEEPRVHPLRLTMVANLFRSSREKDKETDGDKIATSLIAEIREGRGGESAVGRELIDGILIRRIIDHINDAKVKRLADPGLVVRRITPDVIQFVMAPGTPAPGTTPPHDSLEFTPWRIEGNEAQSIFDAFAKEGTLVEREGGALRHLQHVRSEMLPLIRAHSPRRFKLLHELAFAHLIKRAEGDDAAAAEAIYHGLWLGRPLEELDELWSRLTADPRIDFEEFPEDSLVTVYLKARNRERLELAEVRRLPRRVAARWAMDFGEQFLSSSRPNDEIAILRAACGEDFELLSQAPQTRLIVAQLLFRAGLWREARRIIESLRYGRLGQTHQAVMTRTWVNMAATHGGVAEELHEMEKEVLSINDPEARTEIMAYYLLGLGRGKNEPQGLFGASALDLVSKGRASPHLLRLTMLAHAGSIPNELVAAWIIQCSELPRDAGILAPLQRIFDTLVDAGNTDARAAAKAVRDIANAKQLLRAGFNDLDGIWRRHQQTIAKQLEIDPGIGRRIRAIAVFDHSEWHAMLTHALERALGVDTPGLVDALRQNGFIGMSGSARDTAYVAVTRAVENGWFLKLVYLLADPIRARKDTEIPSEASESKLAHEYPQTVAGIAVALKGWHEYLLARFGHQEPPRPPKLSEPKKPRTAVRKQMKKK